MNIFVTDTDPIRAALDSPDCLAVKMPLELCQMLCTALHTALPSDLRPEFLYKPTHLNHPCSIWIRANRSNFAWGVDHAIGLCEVYKQRYGKQHSCRSIIDQCREYSDCLPEAPLSPFAQAINVDAIKALNLPLVEAYRVFMGYKYLTKLKPRKDGSVRHLIDWQRCDRPVWLQNSLEIAQKLV